MNIRQDICKSIKNAGFEYGPMNSISGGIEIDITESGTVEVFFKQTGGDMDVDYEFAGNLAYHLDPGCWLVEGNVMCHDQLEDVPSVEVYSDSNKYPDVMKSLNITLDKLNNAIYEGVAECSKKVKHDNSDYDMHDQNNRFGNFSNYRYGG